MAGAGIPFASPDGMPGSCACAAVLAHTIQSTVRVESTAARLEMNTPLSWKLPSRFINSP
jgi:hypothetical protein